ncbi:MAG: lyase family protein, partial [Eubacteriales bacterium]|nr:lyase family protein [Eubacteriales bacterium]
VLSTLAGIAQSASKFSSDIRLLQHMKEIEEPFEKKQIGSSAMAYKRNPMRSERMASLSRYILVDTLNPAITAATQWLERTLDDSANKRISMAEGFLAADAVLSLYINVIDGLVVNDRVIDRHLREELPFMATENILMDCVKAGGDRQELHERIRTHSMAAAERIKQGDGVNDLLDRIAADPAFPLERAHLDELLDAKLYIGRAPEQVVEFIENDVDPLLNDSPALADMGEIRI